MKTPILNSVKALTVTALMGSGIALSVPAAAITTQGDTITAKIDIRDLETNRGVAKIYKSLSRRAENACKTTGNKSLDARRTEKTCTENLLIDFVQDVGDDRLTSYHQKMNS